MGFLELCHRRTIFEETFSNIKVSFVLLKGSKDIKESSSNHRFQ